MNPTKLVNGSISSMPLLSIQECADSTKVLDFAQKAVKALKDVMDAYGESKGSENSNGTKMETITPKQATLLRTLLLNKADANTRTAKMREMNRFTKAEASELIKELIGR